jgi:predicted cobalt transporter CbtA
MRERGTEAPKRRAMVGAGLLVVMVILFVVLPPAASAEGFPAGLLWGFRLSSFGTQLVFWAGLGALFGLLCERANRGGGAA